MTVVDIIILVVIALGGVIGYKRGFLPQLISLVGFVVVLIGAFLLKNPVSHFLYKHLPFFKFGGILEGATVINIILYEVVAVVFTALLLWIILKIVSLLFNRINRIINDVFIFEIISQIGGCFLGLIENYIVIFLCLYIISLPFFNIDFLKNSKIRPVILNDTPVLSGFIEESIEVFDEISELTNKYDQEGQSDELNIEALDILLKYKFISLDSIDYLVEKNKIEIDGIEKVLSKYRK